MDFTGPYKIEIHTIFPDTVVVDELYEIIYEVKNLSPVQFPGGNVIFHMRWSALGEDLINTHVLEIETLDPDQIQIITFKQRDQVSGLTYLLRPHDSISRPQAIDGILIDLYYPNGNQIRPQQLFFSLRVKSMEEILQEKLIIALETSSKSQNRLSIAEVAFAAAAVFFTIIQVWLTFGNPC